VFLLDSDFCIDWLRGTEYARKALASVLPSDVAVSAVTLGELLIGAYGARLAGKEAQRVDDFLKPIRILEFGRSEAFHFAGIMSVLRKAGQPIGALDAMIAATAMTNKLAVVTRNLKHFERVKDLKVLDWEAKWRN
jgi:tRNA(fMet)-specific endonuclease VapC